LTQAVDTLLIFDLDGTLFQTEKVSYRAAVECFTSFGLDKPGRDEVVDWFGRPIHEFVAWVVTKVGPKASPEEVLDEFSRLEFALIPEAGELFEGVREALEFFSSEGFTLAICSNGSKDYVELVTGEMGIDGHFSRLSCRKGLDDVKPLRVRELKDEFKPERGMVIGDRADDVLAANQNDFFSLGCLYGYAQKGELNEADALIKDPKNLQAVIMQVFEEQTEK